MSAHEELERLADIGRYVEELAEHAKAVAAHSTELATFVTGQFLNNVLWSGSLELDSNGRGQKSVQAVYASVTVADPNGIGPLWIVNDDDTVPESTDSQRPGPGRWLITAGKAATVPLSGTTLTIFSLAGGAPGKLVDVALHAIALPPNSWVA